jgi:preprotein translocase subunit YajC
MTAPLAAMLLFAPSEGNAMLQPLIMFPLIFLVFYFVIMRPQSQQRKKHEAALNTLKKGDEVVTAGGVVGDVIHIKETVKDGTPAPTMADRVTIKSGESRLIIERGRITTVTSRASGSSTAA